VRIFARVFEHFFLKRPYTPVRKLVLFICGYLAIMAKKISEAERIHSQYSSSLTCIKHVHDIKTKVPLKPQDIHVSAVKNFKYVWVCKHRQ